MLQLVKVLNEDDLNISKLIQESETEGYRFVRRLFEEYISKENDFSKDNEILLLAMNEYGIILGVGGVNVNPCGSGGRLRHVYVSPAYRRMGVGRTLVEALIAFAKNHYDTLELRVADDSANKFYEKLGFVQTNEGNASHFIKF